MDNDYPRYKEGWGQTPRNLQDLFRQSGWLEKLDLNNADQERLWKLRQMRINELLHMLDSGFQGTNIQGNQYGTDDAKRYINSNGRWM